MAEKADIQLVIKAPSQNVEDQIIHCNLDWSIEQLKNHISEVYPNKPATNEQKLIYSGHILMDNSHLRDILKNDEKQATLHLVCNWNNRTVNFKDVKFHPSQPAPQAAASPSISSDPPIATESSTNTGTTDGLRQRFVAEPQNVQPNNASPAFWSTPPMVPYESYAAQMAAMQQIYSTYYAQYYQNFQGIPQMGTNLSAPSDIQQNVAVLPQRGGQHETPPVAPVAQPAPPERNMRLNAQGAPELDDNEDMINRDWLDYFYVCCRGFVFFSIVYFYSSPERLMIVVGCVMLALLYQEGYARPRRNARLLANRVAIQIPARPPPAPRVEPADNTEDAPTTPTVNQEDSEREAPIENEIEPIMDGDNPPQERNPVATEYHNPAWTFISTFFSSLIPDQPAPVNIN